MGFKEGFRSGLLKELGLRVRQRDFEGGLIRLPDGFESLNPRVKQILLDSGVYRLDLMTMQIGSVFVAETEQSKFWFTRTLRSRVADDVPDTVQGFMIHTNSPSKSWINESSPDDTYTDRYVRLGEPMYIGKRREETSRVVAYGYML